MKTILIHLALMTFALLRPAVALGGEEYPLPQAMAVLGDSISEAMLTNFSLENPPSTGDFMAMLGIALSTFSSDVRINRFRNKYANKDKSWATGLNYSNFVYSHYERLLEHDSSIKGFNFAISGHKSKDLMGQIDKFLATEENENVNIEYVALLMGANDLVAHTIDKITPALKYIANIEAGLVKILEANGNRRILIVGIPHIIDVFIESAEMHAINIFGADWNCHKMRTTLYGDEATFQIDDLGLMMQVKNILVQYHNGLENMILRLKNDFVNADFILYRDYDMIQNVEKSLSVDCFHPSELGQAELAEKTWENGFYSSLRDKSFDDIIGGFDL